MKDNKWKVITLVCLMLGVLIVNTYYLGQKSGYYVDEGMTLFLANGHYNGAVTSKSDRDFRGFPEAVKLSHYRNVIVLEEQQLSILEDKKPEEQNCNMIVYIYGGLDQDSDLEQICELMGDPQGATQEISSDIMDFKAYEVKWEVE